ncbi:MAG: CHC2 zinc finger domain-containing protein, partial [Fimbriimonadales bacterium]
MRDLRAEIRDRIDLVELVAHYVPLERAGKNFKGLCPFHTEKTPSFYVSPALNRFH